MKTISGNTEVCLRHYFENHLPPWNSKRSGEAKKPLADFAGVGVSAVTRWANTSNIRPLGLPLLKVRFFLDALGYRVSELDSLRTNRVIFQLAELLAYNAWTIDEAWKELGFSGSDEILRLLRGSNTSDSRAERIAEEYERRKESLAAAKDRLLTVLGRAPHREPEAQQAPAPQRPVSETPLEALAHLVLAVTPLLEEVENGTKEQREQLRKLIGGDGMFRLSKASSRLCSEKARAVMRETSR